jgi:hypothetical protein
MTWLIVALVLDRVLLKLAFGTYNCKYTAGYACIDEVNMRVATAPVAYRVLIPWIIGAVERLCPRVRTMRLTALYEPLRIGFIALALAAAEKALGTSAALLVAVLLTATFLFDFADWPVELLSFALALTGDLSLAIAGVGLHAFARPETAALSALTYGLVTGDWFGTALVSLAAIIGIVVVRVVVGRKTLVMKPSLAWTLNWRDLKNLFLNRPFYLSELWMTILIIVGVAFFTLTGQLGAAWPVPVALCVAQCVWQARISETRSLTPALLWIAIGMTR